MDNLVTILLCIYLMLTIRKSGGLYGLLKLILLVHIAGDFVSNEYWETAVTQYAFMREITDEMRLQGNLLLWIAVILSDVGFFGVGYFLGERRNRIGFQGQESFTTSRSLGVFLLIMAFAIKVFIGVNVGFFYVVPADTVGYFGLYSMANTLIPIGAGALFGLNVVPVALIFLTAAIFSYSKAQALIFFVAYAVYCAYGFGARALIKKIFSVNMLVVIVAVVAVTGFKTATRGGESGNSLNTSLVAENFALAVDARLFGGIHRAYLTAVDEIIYGRMGAMAGKYHLQTLYLWIPRSIWPEKPTVASTELRHYLHVEAEDDGTSYAINPFGFLVVDFGLIGASIGAILLGFALRLGEAVFMSFASVKTKNKERKILMAGMITSWVMAAQQLSEGGIPPMVIGVMISSVSCLIGYYLYAESRNLIRQALGLR